MSSYVLVCPCMCLFIDLYVLICACMSLYVPIHCGVTAHMTMKGVFLWHTYVFSASARLSGLFFMHIGLFYSHIGLFSPRIGLFCPRIWLFFPHVGLFCPYIGLFYGTHRSLLPPRVSLKFRKALCVGLFCPHPGLFCPHIGLFYSYCTAQCAGGHKLAGNGLACNEQLGRAECLCRA